jgi:membrane protease YdiL (CAAX protease family)
MSSGDSQRDESDPGGDEPPAGDESTLRPGSIIRMAIAFEGFVVLAALLLGEIVERPPLDAVTFSWTAIGWGVAAAAPMLLAIVLAMKLPFGPIRRLRDFCDEFLVALFRGATWMQIALVSLLAGLGEELLFRGVVQNGLAEAIGGPAGMWVGLAAGSVTFGLAHFVTRTYAVVAGAVGLFFGGLLIGSDNLLVPIVAHAAYDLGAFVYVLRSAPQTAPADGASPPNGE